jgi:glycosyltransferase involved in cell wall biosynthesis
MGRVILYHAQPLADRPEKGSEVRPVRMFDAFRRCGFKVDLVTGYGKQRRQQMEDIQQAIADGVEYHFLYAESTNMPIPLTDPHHLPVRPLQDLLFFRFLSRHSVPIGLFYRDIYWQVDELKYDGPLLKRTVKRVFLWMEWMAFCQYVDHLFLPVPEMSSLLPTSWPKERVMGLPPGCEINPVEPVSGASEPLQLFYVGGVTPPYYDLRPLFDVVQRVDGVQLTLCCREEDWANNRSFYDLPTAAESIQIVHATSEEIGRYYQKADLVADLRTPKGYLKKTMPIKIIEALGYGVPTLLRDGTAAASFVSREGTGWTVSSLSEAEEKLQWLRDHREAVEKKQQSVVEVRHRHTWESRVQEAASKLADLPRPVS